MKYKTGDAILFHVHFVQMIGGKYLFLDVDHKHFKKFTTKHDGLVWGSRHPFCGRTISQSHVVRLIKRLQQDHQRDRYITVREACKTNRRQELGIWPKKGGAFSNPKFFTKLTKTWFALEMGYFRNMMGFPKSQPKNHQKWHKDHIKITNHPKNGNFLWENNMLIIT